MRTAIRILCVGILSAGLCAAQRGGARRGGMNVGRGVPSGATEGSTIDLFRVMVGLRDAQTQQLRGILDAAMREALPVWKQLDAGKDALFNAAKSGTSDEEIGKIAAHQAELTAQMTGLESRTFARIYRMLTSEQKAQADNFLYERLAELLESGRAPEK